MIDRNLIPLQYLTCFPGRENCANIESEHLNATMI